jgi:metal-responsive CopG/Arc/MetJ family transcriptional regulator
MERMPRPKAKSEKVRLNLELTADAFQRLDELQERSRAESRSEVIRRALSVFEKLIECQEEGGEIVIRDLINNRERVLLLT